MFATDRCHRLDDPWRDAAVPVRFHEEDASLQAIVDAARARPVAGVIAVGDRPVVLAARAAGRSGSVGIARGCSRERQQDDRPCVFRGGGLPCRGFSKRMRRAVLLQIRACDIRVWSSRSVCQAVAG